MKYEPFRSFNDIDKKLKVLKLKKEIELEETKLIAHRLRNNVAPSTLLHRLSITSKIGFFRLAGKLVRKIRS